MLYIYMYFKGHAIKEEKIEERKENLEGEQVRLGTPNFHNIHALAGSFQHVHVTCTNKVL